MKSEKNSIAVIGAGSWGTALAIHLARNQQQVRLWGNEDEHLQTMQQTRCNQHYLPGIELPENISVCNDMDSAITGAEDILIVVPSHAFRLVIQEIKKYSQDNTGLIWASKGLDPQNTLLLHDVLKEELGPRDNIAVLSGPSFAMEVAQGLLTAVTLASPSETFAEHCYERFHNDKFRVYLSDDLIGVQLGGTVKNVIAIATGVSDSLGNGANARAAIITRGLAEMTALGLAMGAKRETFTGLATLGDIVLTCCDDQSRNRRYGLALGRGESSEQALESIGQVVEGLFAAKQVMDLSQRFQVKMPICEAVSAMVNNKITPKDAMNQFLIQTSKHEC